MNRLIHTVLLCAASALCLGCPSQMGTSVPATPEAEGDWSIQLAEYRNAATHIAAAENYLKAAKGVTKWDDLYVLHEDNVSRVYCGSFTSRLALEPRLKQVRTWKNKSGVDVFRRAIPVNMGTLTGDANDKYDIRNAPHEARYTMVVAMFQSSVAENYDRHKQCQYTVNEFRKQGVEAWFYHGQNYSAVMVGAFPESAVIKIHVPVRHPVTNDVSYRDKFDVRDVKLKALMKEYPDLLINGMVEYINHVNVDTGTAARKPRSTYVSVIPGRTVKHSPASTNEPGAWRRTVEGL
ncbi:MAG: hypothetical protein HN909_07370 [Phycisphaerales bacterium]|jgi:hypothetical protein|nr:hypothetical protein [Phycisphaerales bacterium]MBT7171572.1 hypothetical protein [Phycisphaerales bacterium]